MWHPGAYDQPTKGHTPKENSSFLSSHQSVTPQGGVEVHEHVPIHAVLLTGLILRSPMNTTTAAMSVGIDMSR